MILVILTGVVGLWLAGSRYPSGWLLFALAQLLAIPYALAGAPAALLPLLAACGLVALVNWRANRRPLIRRSWRRGVVRARW